MGKGAVFIAMWRHTVMWYLWLIINVTVCVTMLCRRWNIIRQVKWLYTVQWKCQNCRCFTCTLCNKYSVNIWKRPCFGFRYGIKIPIYVSNICTVRIYSYDGYIYSTSVEVKRDFYFTFSFHFLHKYLQFYIYLQGLNT